MIWFKFHCPPHKFLTIQRMPTSAGRNSTAKWRVIKNLLSPLKKRLTSWSKHINIGDYPLPQSLILQAIPSLLSSRMHFIFFILFMLAFFFFPFLSLWLSGQVLLFYLRSLLIHSLDIAILAFLYFGFPLLLLIWRSANNHHTMPY